MDNKPQWSHWCWGNTGIFRHRYSDWKIEEECSNCAYLEQHLEQLQRLKQELIDRADEAKGTRKREFERGIKSKEGQIEYVQQRLHSLTEEKKMAEVEVIPAEALTEREQRELKQLEEEIEQSFVRAGRAFRIIRDSKLYRQYGTFEQYCRERFGFSDRRHPYRLIAAIEVIENLFPKNVTNLVTPVMPSSESQVRPLTKLEPKLQKDAWAKAVDETGGRVPPARVVKDVVEQIKEEVRKRANLPCPFQVGEVCQVLVKGNPELRGLAGAWCIVEEVREFIILIQTWKGEFVVKEENLKSFEFNPEEQQAFQEISDRLTALYSKCSSEGGALHSLEWFARVNRPSLTNFEEKMLQFLEETV